LEVAVSGFQFLLEKLFMKSSRLILNEDLEMTKDDIIREIDVAQASVIKWIIAMALFQLIGSIIVLKLL